MSVERAEPILPARSIEETRRFYQELGFTSWWGGAIHQGYEILSRGNLVVHFYLDTGVVPAENSAMCYWRVPDADRFHAELSRAGLATTGIPRLTAPADQAWGMREFALVDPAGNLIRIGHELARSSR